KAIQVNDAWEKIYSIAYESAVLENSIQAYESFIYNYPKAKQVVAATEKIHELAFEEAKIENTYDSYRGFTLKYPNSIQYKQAEELYYLREFEENTIEGNWESYRDFYENFEGPYSWISRDSLINIAIHENNTKALLYCIQGNLGNKKDLIIQYYYQISSDGELSSLNRFKEKFSDYIYLLESFDKDIECAQFAEKIGLTTENFSINVNSEMEKRLKREGAKTGAITISLMWDNFNDIDLHCIDPNGEEIFYGHRNSKSGGELDVDMNAEGPYSNEPVENIYWENSKAKKGKYVVYLNHYRNHNCYGCEDPTNYTVVVKQNNITKEFKGKITYGDSKRLIHSFEFTNKNYGEIDLTTENKLKLDQYIKMAPEKELAFVAVQKIISKDVSLKNWSQVLSILQSYEPFFSNNPKFKKLKDVIKESSDFSIKIEQLKIVNSESGDEYSPVISGDSKSLFFCGYNRSDNFGGEDVFLSKKESSGWSNPKVVESLSNSASNDALMAVSTDGSKSILFNNGKLAYSQKLSDGWSPLNYFPNEINNCSWNGDAMITSDGNALIFASVRENDGYSIDFAHNEFYHSTQAYFSDIYASLRTQDGWSTPINLGNTINTNFIERSPFLHPDMKTLYFSSDGHGGIGKLDVYKSTRLADSCWNCWSEPVNLGKEINTVSDDWGYRISTDGTTAYFSKKENGKKTDDIYSLTLPPHLRPDIVAKIEGTLKNSKNEPISTSILWEDLENNKIIGSAKTDPSNGSYFIVLPMGKNYGYFIEDSTYFPLSQNMDLRNIVTATELKKDIKVITIDEMIKDGISVTMNNLFFDFGKYELLSTSYPELKRVAKIIKRYKLKVEISGHTDDIGDDKSNQLLSERRAMAVKDYLQKLGCQGGSLVTVGFGESKPFVPNENENNRSLNRRVELRFIN
ncbi:MAG: OmpA family protein, partial [Bacteroidota bacterium]